MKQLHKNRHNNAIPTTNVLKKDGTSSYYKYKYSGDDFIFKFKLLSFIFNSKQTISNFIT